MQNPFVFLYYFTALIRGNTMKFVIYGIKFTHKPGEFCPRRKFDSYFVSCFLTDYLYEYEGRLVRGRAGDFLIMPPNSIVYHGPTPEMTDGFINDWMHISGDDFGELIKKYDLPTEKPFHIDGSFYLSAAIGKIHREMSCAEPGYEDKCNCIMTDAIIDIYRSYNKLNSVSQQSRLDYVRGEIMKDYKRNWTLSELAAISGYSVSRLSALYKGTFGVSPINDLINRRIEQAKLLILYGNMTVSEITEAVGFSSIFYFSKMFKRKEGISPAKFKEKLYK